LVINVILLHKIIEKARIPPECALFYKKAYLCIIISKKRTFMRTYTAATIYDYDPYGKILRSFTRTEAGEKYLTTGHERDTETDLDYRGARFYDSEVVRFLSLDPLAAKYAAWSPYNYVLGNPIRLVDKDGKAPNPPRHTYVHTIQEQAKVTGGSVSYFVMLEVTQSIHVGNYTYNEENKKSYYEVTVNETTIYQEFQVNAVGERKEVVKSTDIRQESTYNLRVPTSGTPIAESYACAPTSGSMEIFDINTPNRILLSESHLVNEKLEPSKLFKKMVAEESAAVVDKSAEPKSVAFKLGQDVQKVESQLSDLKAFFGVASMLDPGLAPISSGVSRGSLFSKIFMPSKEQMNPEHIMDRYIYVD
jgi:RHS repeat-associated protein